MCRTFGILRFTQWLGLKTDKRPMAEAVMVLLCDWPLEDRCTTSKWHGEFDMANWIWGTQDPGHSASQLMQGPGKGLYLLWYIPLLL